MTSPSGAYALPKSRPMPAGVRPGPVFIPAPPEAKAVLAPPAGPRMAPRSTARQLCMLLHGHGVRGMYANACGNVAVVSLPEFNVWISPGELAWTYHGEPGTWPASDPAGAADHLIRLACPAEPQNQADASPAGGVGPG